MCDAMDRALCAQDEDSKEQTPSLKDPVWAASVAVTGARSGRVRMRTREILVDSSSSEEVDDHGWVEVDENNQNIVLVQIDD